AVLQHLDDALADDLDLFRSKLLENREHQLLLAHGRGVLDLVLFRKGKQFGGGFGLEVLEFHFPHAGKSLRLGWPEKRFSRWRRRRETQVFGERSGGSSPGTGCHSQPWDGYASPPACGGMS